MMYAANALDRASYWLARVTSGVVVIAAFGFCLALLLQVAFRYVLNAPLSWSEELATLMFVWATVLAASVAVRHGNHLRLTIIEAVLGPRAALWCGCLCQALMGGFGVFLVIDGWRLANLVWTNTSAAIGYPMWCLYLSVPVSGFLMALHSLVLLTKAVSTNGAVHPIAGDTL